MCRQIIIYCVWAKCARECCYKNRLLSEHPHSTAQCVVINFLANIWCIHYLSMYILPKSIQYIFDFGFIFRWRCVSVLPFFTIDRVGLVGCVRGFLRASFDSNFRRRKRNRNLLEADKEHERRWWVFTVHGDVWVPRLHVWHSRGQRIIYLPSICSSDRWNGKQMIESCHGERE